MATDGRDFIYIVSDLLPDYLVPTSLEVRKFATRYVTIREGEKQESLNWPGFHQAVMNYSGDDLTFDKFINHKVKQDDASVSALCDSIVAYIRDALGLTLSDELVEKIRRNLENAFTNFKQGKEHGWAAFSSSATEHSSWEYRVLYASPNPDLRDFFYSLVTTIKLEADIKEESSWWGMTNNTTKNFSAKIDAMQLVVMKGFKDPGYE